MAQELGIGILAGLVSALLFGVLIQASPLAFVLYLLAPLPILIVGLGWSYRAALAAVVAGSLALALIAPYLGIAFAIYLAVPAWWLAYLAALGRPGADGHLEWYPLGRLLAWVAATAALAFVAIAAIAAPDYATYRTQITQMARKVVQVRQRGPGAPPADAATPDAGQDTPDPSPPEPGASDPDASAANAPDANTPTTAPAALRDEIATALATLAPGFAAQGLAILLVIYLWLAARVVQISGRLLRPWPDIPSTVMPRAVLGVLALAVALILVPGYPGVLGVALSGALSAAFALQGLAAFHDRSRGRPARGALLIGLYLVLVLTQGVALVALMLFGIADTAFNRRSPARAPQGRA